MCQHFLTIFLVSSVIELSDPLQYGLHSEITTQHALSCESPVDLTQLDEFCNLSLETIHIIKMLHMNIRGLMGIANATCSEKYRVTRHPEKFQTVLNYKQSSQIQDPALFDLKISSIR